ncbi:hypothetical protein GFL88_00165 [Rhizobium leguminosarum bv. viciae]|uniref:hypothetical protein n=1 Tax=Rhizobium leguminosarum TaxID=384 RepID=UPI0014424695|nr:hypothetical protein [Rhizobium leguminosarum]NKK61972.1 hypothetical protein [Rhizobium leguminosarum bv. viciae]
MRLNFEVLLVSLSFWCGIVGSCQADQICAPVSTEAVDSVALLHFPVGYQNIKPYSRQCLDKNGPEADFAAATIFAKGGLYEAAIAYLTTPDGKLSDRAALLAADIFFTRAEGNDLDRAKFLFADLATRGNGYAKIGLALTVLATSKTALDREKAVQNLLDARSTLVLAQLGAMLVQAGISSVERDRGRQYLEQASAQGEIAAKVELAKLLMRPGPYQDEARAVGLLQPGVSRRNSDALFLAAGLWAQGFGISQRVHERYLNEQANILAWSNGLRAEAKSTGNYERAEAAEGYVIERNLGFRKSQGFSFDSGAPRPSPIDLAERYLKGVPADLFVRG